MKPSNQISSLPVSGHSVPPTEADPLTPAEADPLASTEGVFSHSVTSTEGVFCQMLQFRPRKQYFAIQLRSTEDTAPVTSTEERSQMNCASISEYG